ncbi:hypothetical protein MSAN_02534000 [Mycena sanguinolenta]|uniref:Uncharacterized protein n=1 Tax=Mycena sanguinolenta TaxID=230812 RepID=A0A8H6TUE9_9AGAR|nr:hypothetical protein MSAN_02534000 [Mycena sanguinolenta]
MRHLFQIALVALQCRDLLQGIKADQERRYKLPDTLAKLCQDYAHVALLSPKARCYRNSNKGNPTIAKSIVAAMRSLGVSDMPPAYETGRCDVLLKVLGKALTDKRYLIKTAIMESLSGSKVDIATLTRTCIGTSPAQPTAALYQRIAFLRSVAVSYSEANPTKKKKPSRPRPPVPEGQASDQPAQPDDFEKENVKDKEKDDGFWKAVDDQLAVYYIDSFTSADRQRLWDTKYQADVRLYGPVDNTLPITLMADLEVSKVVNPTHGASVSSRLKAELTTVDHTVLGNVGTAHTSSPLKTTSRAILQGVIQGVVPCMHTVFTGC